jgi:hypothetical protein
VTQLHRWATYGANRTNCVQVDAHIASDHHPDTQSVLYSLDGVESPSSADVFRIEPRSGRVVLVTTLDYELQTVHRLIVAARYNDALALAYVTVRVIDENDNAPVFPKKRCAPYECTSVHTFRL